VNNGLSAEKSRGQGGSAAKQVPPQPGAIPALGLRAGAMAFSLYRRPALERRKIVVFSSWLRNWKRSAPAARRVARKQRFLPRLDVLEDRLVPSGFQQINLVGYQPGMAHFTDPNLNGWGMTSMPDGSYVVANAFSSGLVTFYDRSGHVLPQTIAVPSSSVPTLFGMPGSPGHPTGVVYNSTSDFVISENGKSAPALLIFDTVDGTISGWNPAVDATHAIVMRDTWAAGNPAVYTGLEIGQDSAGDNVIYAADFLGPNGTPTSPKGRVEMIDGSFTTIRTFTDPNVTSYSDGSYGAWSVQAVGDKLYVTYASLADLGGGVVDVFDADGGNMVRVAANYAGIGQGPLQNPWGITQAPANFGAYSNDILIGNVAGAGNINVFDPITGNYLGQLNQPNGTPIAIKGLWDLEFGDGPPGSGKTNWLYFDAGPNHPGDATGGLFGVIKPAGDQGSHPSADLSSALLTGVLSPGSGGLLGGVQAQPATSPSPAPAAGAPSASAAGSSQAVPLVSTPPGLALGVATARARDQVFANLEGIHWGALALTADSPWTW
jgi:uncharacterized protein (TIGR03118 family)